MSPNQPISSTEPSSNTTSIATKSALLPYLPVTLRRFLQVSVALVAICLIVELFCQIVLHLGYPYNWPLMFPDASFGDFRWYFVQFQRLHTAAFFEGPDIIMYPAPVVLCYWFFYSFQPYAIPVFLGFIISSSLVAAFFVSRFLVKRGLAPRQAAIFVAVSYVLSYPFWFEFKQANMEIVLWVILCLAFVFLWKRNDWIGAGLIGIAGAMKFYPLIYLGLLFSRKKYKECFFGCFVAVATMLVGLWLLGPTIPIAWHGMQTGLARFHLIAMITVRGNEIGFDHSIFAFVKSVCRILKHIGFPGARTGEAFSMLLSIYLPLVGVGGVILYFLRIRHLPQTNQLLAITVAAILLPPVSFDYTLIYLYPPWVLLVILAIRAEKAGLRVRGLNAMLVCIAVSVSPLSEFIFQHERVGGQLKAVFLLAIFVMSLRFPLNLPGDAEGPFDLVNATPTS